MSKLNSVAINRIASEYGVGQSHNWRGYMAPVGADMETVLYARKLESQGIDPTPTGRVYLEEGGYGTPYRRLEATTYRTRYICDGMAVSVAFRDDKPEHGTVYIDEHGPTNGYLSHFGPGQGWPHKFQTALEALLVVSRWDTMWDRRD